MNGRSMKSDLAKVNRTRDEAIDYTDSPPLDDSFFTRAVVEWPPRKASVTRRLDADVLRWFRAQGRGYQTRINRLLGCTWRRTGKTADRTAGKTSRARPYGQALRSRSWWSPSIVFTDKPALAKGQKIAKYACSTWTDSDICCSVHDGPVGRASSGCQSLAGAASAEPCFSP